MDTIRHAPVRGREAELAALAALADAARRGSGTCAIVRGRPGTGRTTLLDRVAAREAGLGAMVLRPSDVAGELIGVPIPAVEPYPVLRRLQRTLAELTRAQPVCLLLDDLPEEDTRWLDFVLRRSVHIRLFTVVTGSFATLATRPYCTVVHLGPLPRHVVAELTVEALGEPAPVEFLYRLSAGNPGLLGQALSGVDETGAVADSVVAEVTLAKVGRLPGPARAAVEAIAVLGRVEPALVAALAGLPPDAVADAVRLLEREHLLWPGLRDRTAAAILGRLAPDERAALRIRAAVVLQDSGRPAEEVADQLVELASADQPWMTRVLASARGPADRVSVYLARALAGELPGRLRVGLVMRQARVAPAAALAGLSAVFASATEPAERARIAVVLALTARACGRADREPLLLAAKDLAAAPPGPDLADLRTLLDAALMAITRAAPAPASHTTTEPTAAERCLLGMLAEATMRAGGPVEVAVRQARQAVADPDVVDDWSTPAAALVLRCAGHFDESLRVLDRAIAHFVAGGDELGECRLLTCRARVLIATGALCSAERDARQAFTIAARNSWLSHEPRTAIVLALVSARLGRPDTAARLLDDVDRGGEYDYGVHYATAWLHMARRDWPAAIDELFACGRAMAGAGLHNPVLVPWWADAAILGAALAGQPARAAAALDHGLDLARQWRTPEYTALVTLVRGLVAPSTTVLAEAVTRFAALPTRLWHAFAEFLLGRAHVAAGDHVTARPHLRTAIDLALNLGHEQWVAEAHQLLQQAGGRMRVRPATEHDVLTTSERRVVELAAGGQSNREIADALVVSLRTVEQHLTRAYRKLGVAGRTQLRSTVAELASVATRELRPAPLSAAATRRFLADTLGQAPDDEFVLACHESSGGSPMILAALAHDVGYHQLSPTAEHAGRVRSLRPGRLRDRMTECLRTQDPAVLAFGRALAALGEHAEEDLVGLLAGLDAAGGAEAARTMRRLGLLDSGLGFAHPVVRDAVEATMTLADRERLRLAATRLLHRRGHPVEQVAARLLTVTSDRDAWVVAVLRSAADAAARRGEPETAARYLRRALLDATQDRAQLLVDLATVERGTDPAAAARHIAYAVPLLATARDKAVAVARIPPAMLGHEPPLVRDLAEEVAAELGPPAALTGPDRDLALRLEARLRHAALAAPAELADAARRLADLGPAPATATGAERELLTVLAYAATVGATVPARVAGQLVVDVLDREAATPDHVHTALPLAVLVLTAADRVAPLLPWLAAALADARAERMVIRAEQAVALLYLGRADEARAAALEVAAHESSATNAVAATALSMVALELRDPELTKRVLAWPGCAQVTDLLRAAAAAQAGEAQALEDVLACGRRLDRSGWRNPVLFPWQPVAALLHHRLGDRESALALAEDAHARAVAWGAPSGIGRALRVRGQLTPGPAGVTLLREAVSTLDDSANTLELAKARAQLDRRTAAEPWRPLTRSEVRVTRLAVEDRTNAEIAETLGISSRAVEKHLTNSFRKLGIRRRTELAGALAAADDRLP